MKKWKYCDSENSDSATKCAVSGAQEFESQLNKVCPRCGMTYNGDSCPGCGYPNASAHGNAAQSTMNQKQTNPNKKRKTWLWVLGWIFFLPLPLTILFIRKKSRNTIVKILKVVILVVVWLFYVLFCIAFNQTINSSGTDDVAQNGAYSDKGVSHTVEETTVTRGQSKKTSSNVKSIDFSYANDVTVKVGQTYSSDYAKINVKSIKDFSPEDIIFVSDNPEIATIELDHVARTTHLYYAIKGIGEGETALYAMSSDGSVESDHIKVTVPTPIGVDTIKFENVKSDLVLKETTSPKVIISPHDAEEKVLAWASSDETVATVDSNGTVTALATGSVTVTAKAPSGAEASFVVNVDGTKTLMKLNVSRKRLDDVNIGSDWNYDTSINGEHFAKTIGIAEGEKLLFKAEFTENDKKPDVGKASKTHIVTKEDISNGFSVSMDVYVTENGGQNSGKSAHFIVTFELSPNN